MCLFGLANWSGTILTGSQPVDVKLTVREVFYSHTDVLEMIPNHLQNQVDQVVLDDSGR